VRVSNVSTPPFLLVSAVSEVTLRSIFGSSQKLHHDACTIAYPTPTRSRIATPFQHVLRVECLQELNIVRPMPRVYDRDLEGEHQ
jgi:hypothetical protein